MELLIDMKLLKIFIFGACWLLIAKIGQAATADLKLPMCENQSNLIDSFSSILKQHRHNVIGKREVGDVLICFAILVIPIYIKQFMHNDSTNLLHMGIFMFYLT